jgi:CheY-like chemotaxis protein
MTMTYKVLIVDDNADNLTLLSHVLRKMNHEAVPACNGVDALALLQEKQDINFIITDLEMPEMDGEEFIRRKNQLPDKCSIPTVLWSANVIADQIAMKHNAIFLNKLDVLSKKLECLMVSA